MATRLEQLQSTRQNLINQINSTNREDVKQHLQDQLKSVEDEIYRLSGQASVSVQKTRFVDQSGQVVSETSSTRYSGVVSTPYGQVGDTGSQSVIFNKPNTSYNTTTSVIAERKSREAPVTTVRFGTDTVHGQSLFGASVEYVNPESPTSKDVDFTQPYTVHTRSGEVVRNPLRNRNELSVWESIKFTEQTGLADKDYQKFKDSPHIEDKLYTIGYIGSALFDVAGQRTFGFPQGFIQRGVGGLFRSSATWLLDNSLVQSAGSVISFLSPQSPTQFNWPASQTYAKNTLLSNVKSTPFSSGAVMEDLGKITIGTSVATELSYKTSKFVTNQITELSGLKVPSGFFVTEGESGSTIVSRDWSSFISDIGRKGSVAISVGKESGAKNLIDVGVGVAGAGLSQVGANLFSNTLGTRNGFGEVVDLPTRKEKKDVVVNLPNPFISVNRFNLPSATGKELQTNFPSVVDRGYLYNFPSAVVDVSENVNINELDTRNVKEADFVNVNDFGYVNRLNVNVPKFPNIPSFNFQLPSGGSGKGFKSGFPNFKGERAYTPSLTATVFRIKKVGKAPVGANLPKFSGLEIRPIYVRRLGKRKKRKKKR